MATFVLLANFTEQGIRNVEDTSRRADIFKEWATSLDIEVKGIYWTLGRYDIVSIVEAPDDIAMTALGLSLGRAGNVRTETLHAYSQDELASILAKVV